MTSARRRLRAVTFDLGDTVWHFPNRKPPEEVLRHLARRIEHLLRGWAVQPSVPPLDIQARLTEARSAAEQAVESSGNAGPDYLAVVREVLASLRIDLNEAQVQEVWQAQNVGGDYLGRHIFEDTVPTLEWLRGRGVRLAALTNRSHGGAAFLEELRREGLLDYFDAVVSSDQVGYRKPHPRIFERALEVLDLPAEECAHVGDRLGADVAGARRVGMFAIWMRRLRPSDEQPSGEHETPDLVIERLRDLTSSGLFDKA